MNVDEIWYYGTTHAVIRRVRERPACCEVHLFSDPFGLLRFFNRHANGAYYPEGSGPKDALPLTPEPNHDNV